MSTTSPDFPYFRYTILFFVGCGLVWLFFGPLQNYVTATFGIATTLNNSSSPLESGLIGHWTFDGADVDWSSTTAEITDRSGQNNNGDAQGDMSAAVSPTIGVLGQAMRFDGVDDHVIIGSGDGSYCDVASSNFSFSGWFRSEANGTVQHIISAGNLSLGDGYDVRLQSSGELRFWFSVGASDSMTLESASDGLYDDGGWHHFVAVRDDVRTGKLYIDAQLVAEDTDNSGSSSAVDTVSDCFIGRAAVGSAEPFAGTLDDVRFYNRALSADEVERLYKMGEGVKVASTIQNADSPLESGLIGHWTFDGADVDWSSTTAEVRTRSADVTTVSTNWGDDTQQGSAFTANWLRCMGGNGPAEATNLTGVYVSSAAGTAQLRLAVYQGGTLSDPRTASLVWDAGVVDDDAGFVGVTTSGVPLAANTPTWICVKGNDNSFTLHANASHDATSDFQSTRGRWQAAGLSTDETVPYPSTLLGGGISFSGFWYSFYLVTEQDVQTYHHGDAQGGLDARSPVAGVVGQGMQFDGVEDHVHLYEPQGLKLDFPFSYTGWINLDTTVGGWVYAYGHQDNCLSEYIGSGLYVTAATLSGYFNGGGGCAISNRKRKQGTVSLNTGEWYQVAGVFSSADDITLYLNGNDIGGSYVGSATSVDYGTGHSAYLGARDGSAPAQFFPGSLDDVRVYNRALSADEVERLYKMGEGVKVASTIQNADSPLESGLIGHWTFDGADVDWSSTTAEITDRSGQNNNGDAQGDMSAAVSPTIGVLGQAMRFDGVDDHVDVPTFAESLLPATITAWVKPVDFENFDGIVFSRDASTASGMNIRNSGLGYHWNDDSGTYSWTGGPDIPLNEWSLLVLVVESDKATAYVASDTGIVSGTNTRSHTVAFWGSLGLGHDGGGSTRRINGAMDDIRIYNRALSAREVELLYQLGR